MQSLIPSKKIPQPVIATEEPLSSSPFVMPKNTAAEAPFTGRVKELDLLRALYREVISVKHAGGNPKDDLNKPLVIGIKGEAGIGKSRLLTEFQKNITASNHKKNFIYSAGCVSSGQEAYGLFRGFFSESNLLKQAVTSERKTLIQNKISENILNLAREARRNELPLVILLEDMQWADELSLAALDHFLSAINLTAAEEGILLFLLLNYRPAFKPGRIIRKDCRLVEIELKGFSESESKQFISKLTGSKKISANTVELISRRSEGNPFNIEELCRSIDGNAKHLKLPATVKRLLADKVSQLEKDERAVLIIASVLGRKFSLKLLNAILKKAGKQSADADVMSRLEERKYLVNLTSDVYEFRHDLLHEIIYRELKKELKKNVHALAAASIEETYSAKLSAHYYELVRHYEAAGDEPNTIKYLEKAGDKARENYENERAIKYYKRLVSNNECLHIDVLLKLGGVYKTINKWEDATHTYKTIVKLTQRKNTQFLSANIGLADIALLQNDYRNSIRQWKQIIKYDRKREVNLECLCGLGRCYLAIANYYKAFSYFNELLYQSKKSFDNIALSKGYEYLGRLYRLNGKYAKALTNYSKSIEINTELKNRITIASLFNRIGGVHFNMGEYENALRFFRKSILTNEKIGLKYGNINNYSNIGLIYLSKQRYKDAKHNFAKQLKLATEIGDEVALAAAYSGLGNVFLFEGKYDCALENYEKSLQINNRLKKKASVSHIISNIGLIKYYLGKFDEAFEMFCKQLLIDKKLGNKEGILRSTVNTANCARWTNREDLSVRYYRKVVKMSKELSLNKLLTIALFNIAELYFDLAEYKKARAYNEQCGEVAYRNCFNIEIFNYQLLKEKITIYDTKIDMLHKSKIDSMKKIIKMLSKTKVSENEAIINFELWKISKKIAHMAQFIDMEKHKSRALMLFQKEYEVKPYFYFKKCINEIKKKGN